MLTPLLALTSVLLGGSIVQPSPSSNPPEPIIRLWLSDDGRYRPGDRAKVEVKTRDDGYLLVLHVDPQHHLRVLFPLNPGDDNFVRGGKRYEIQGRGGREAFTVTSRGTGTVYAAVSRQRFDFGPYVEGGQWNLAALDSVDASRDPEAGLNAFVRTLSQGDFDYDLLAYGTYARRGYAYAPYYAYPYGYPYYYPPFGTSFFFGLDFYRPFFYRPFGFHRFGFGFHHFGRFH